MSFIFKLKSIEIDHYKGINHGVIDFVEYQKKKGINSSGITAIFGENGSGKSTVCECLEILSNIVRVDGFVPIDLFDEFLSHDKNDFINKKIDMAYKMFEDSPTSTFSYTFDVYDKTKLINTLTYSILFERKKINIQRTIPDNSFEQDINKEARFLNDNEYETHQMFCADLICETFTASGLFNGKKIKQQEIFSFNHKTGELTPLRKQKLFLGTGKDAKKKLAKLKDPNNYSVLCWHKLLSYENKQNNDYFNLIDEFSCHVSGCILSFVNETDIFIGYKNPIDPFSPAACFINEKDIDFVSGNIISTVNFTDDLAFNTFKNDLNSINKLLNMLLPGIKIGTRILSNNHVYEKDYHGNTKIAKLVMITSTRNNHTFPIQYESVGAKKLINLISGYIAAFRKSNILFVIDELDYGLHEYLIQILLEAFIRGGKGQLVFTSHNLRPLEILPKESIVFTTINPNNRFYRFIDIREKNNLRNCYYDEITNSADVKRKKQEQILFHKISVEDILEIFDDID